MPVVLVNPVTFCSPADLHFVQCCILMLDGNFPGSGFFGDRTSFIVTGSSMRNPIHDPSAVLGRKSACFSDGGGGGGGAQFHCGPLLV